MFSFFGIQATEKKKAAKAFRAAAKFKGRGRGKGRGCSKGKGSGKGKKGQGKKKKKSPFDVKSEPDNENMMGAVPGPGSQPDSLGTTGREQLFDVMFANPVNANSDAAGSGSHVKPPTGEPGDEPVHGLIAERPCEPAASMPSQPEIPRSVEAPEPPLPEESSGATLAEIPVTQPQHDASDAVPPVSVPAPKGPTGPRGPNVNSSPTSLAEISPPGCRITLNCSLVASVI